MIGQQKDWSMRQLIDKTIVLHKFWSTLQSINMRIGQLGIFPTIVSQRSDWSTLQSVNMTARLDQTYTQWQLLSQIKD